MSETENKNQVPATQQTQVKDAGWSELLFSSFGDYTDPSDMNIFFTVYQRAIGSTNRDITMTFDDIAGIENSIGGDNVDLEDRIKGIFEMQGKMKSRTETRRFNFFESYGIDAERRQVTLTVTKNGLEFVKRLAKILSPMD